MQNNLSTIVELLEKIPQGISYVWYNNKKYSLTRTDYNGGRSTKVFAEELGGNDFISFNYYYTKSGGQFKPCEMAGGKVMEFLQEMEAFER
ncbi:MAG: peptide methionine sulfoxide reductase [Saprospiraceae bacterium]